MKTRNEKLSMSVVDPAQMRTQKRYGGIEDVCVYLSLGTTAAREVCRRADAVIVIGRRRVYDLEKVDSYLENNPVVELPKRIKKQVQGGDA